MIGYRKLLLALATVTALWTTTGSVAAQYYYPAYPVYPYAYNPYVPYVGGSAYYNPYTGGYMAGRSYYNPYTGGATMGGAGYNPYTGNVVRAGVGYNPYTGASAPQRPSTTPIPGAMRYVTEFANVGWLNSGRLRGPVRLAISYQESYHFTYQLFAPL